MNTTQETVLTRLRIASIGGILNATVATLLAAAIIPPLMNVPGLEGRPGPWDLVKVAFLLIPLLAVWVGPFAFVSGALGIVWLHWRKARLKTRRRLVLEAMLAGFFLSLLFPFYDAAINRYGAPADVLAVPIGMLCAIACANILRRSLGGPATS